MATSALWARVIVTLRSPEVQHIVTVGEFERWLDASPRSPAEMVRKNRLREMLGASETFPATSCSCFSA
jgi:hypothetical protein